MKKKIFFSLLQSSIIFLLAADISKVAFQYNAWVRLAVLAFIFSNLGAVFFEYYNAQKKKEKKEKKEKIIYFKLKKKDKDLDEEYKDFDPKCIVIMVFIAIVLVFIEGVLFEVPPYIDTFASELAFYFGAIIYGICLYGVK